MGGAKRKFEEFRSSTDGQVSAFAAAKAWRESTPGADLIESDVSDGEVYDDGASNQIDRPYVGDLGDGTINYDSDSDQEAATLRVPSCPPAADIELSTWRPSDRNIILQAEKAITVALTPGQTITFLGQFDLLVKTGLIDIYGATLSEGPTKYRVFAPSSHALPAITCRKLNSRDKKCEVEIWQCGHTLRGLRRLSPLFGRLWNTSGKSVPTAQSLTVDRHTFKFLSKTGEDPLNRPLSQLQLPPSWKSVMDGICSTPRLPRVLICGPKGTGKSTFGRMLSNRLVTLASDRSPSATCTTLCWLDLDPGQPEFSPPGQVSLVQIRKPNFGPPFTHPFTDITTATRILRAHSIASISPKDDPEHYMACAMELMEHYNRLVKDFPKCGLIVNCSGWVLGSALEVTAQLVRKLGPTNIVYTSKGPRDVINVLQNVAGKIPFQMVASSPPSWISRTSYDLRAMQYMSYFHQCTPVDGELRWNAASITSFNSWVLKYSGEGQQVLAVQVLNNVGSQFLSTVLDGCLVSVVLVTDPEAVPKDEVQRTPENMPYWPCGEAGRKSALEPHSSYLIGLGLVRDIDIQSQQIALYTPISETVREEAVVKSDVGDPRIVLIRGKLDTPGWAYFQELLLEERSRLKSVSSDAGHRPELQIGMTSATRSIHDLPRDQEPERPWLRRILPGDTGDKIWKVRRDLRTQSGI